MQIEINDKIQYQLRIDTGHVENTDTPNCVPYTFPIPASLETEGYILQNLRFNESSRVGNCYINYTIDNNTIRLEAVAKAVRDASRLSYKAGGHLEGTAILTFQKITSETEEINYEFNVDTGHVENTDIPNRVSYTFPVDFHLLKQSYTVSKFEFSESSRVGNCYINPIVENGVIKIEAVAQAVKASSGLWYKAGGYLKGTVCVTLRKTEYIGDNSKHETSQITINKIGNQYNILEVSTMTINESINQTGNFGIGVNKGQVKAEKLAATINEAQPKSLAETAAEIQQLLKQLEESNPTNTAAGQMAVATQAVEIVESNPTLKQRVVGALQSAGTEAFKEALDHPVANVLVAAFEGWTKP